MTSVRDCRKSLAGLAVLALTVTAVGTLLPTPARASYYEGGVSISGRIIRDSVPYRLNIKAIEAMGFTYRLQVSISKLKTPTENTSLRQTQTWIYELEEGDFTQDGDSYRIDAGGNDEAFHVQVNVDRRQDAHCSEGQRLFVTQPNGGKFRIETGNQTFGTITELPGCATVYSFGSGEIPGPPSCPLVGEELQSGALNVKERRLNEVARINVSNFQERNVSGQAVRWFVNLRGTVPESRFRLSPDLHGSLRAGKAPWLDGKASLEPKRPVHKGDWYDCRGKREARSSTRRVAVTGDLTLRVIGYENYKVHERDALALRSWVRPRT